MMPIQEICKFELHIRECSIYSTLMVATVLPNNAYFKHAHSIQTLTAHSILHNNLSLLSSRQFSLNKSFITTKLYSSYCLPPNKPHPLFIHTSHTSSGWVWLILKPHPNGSLKSGPAKTIPAVVATTPIDSIYYERTGRPFI